MADDIARLYAHRGPFVTAYLDTTAAVEDAAYRAELAWRAQREKLAAAGAGEESLAAITAVTEDAHLRGAGLAVVAAGGRALLVDHWPEPPARPGARLDALPWAAPLLHARQGDVPHMVVAADRAGADITVVTAARETEETVDGSAGTISKKQPGGWSQRRYQQRADNAWEKNASEVAAEVSRLAAASGAQLIVVTGDVRAVALLEEALPFGDREKVAVVQGGSRHPGAAGIDDELRRLVATVAARETTALLERFKEQRGREDRAADGAAATLAALSKAQVEVLLVGDDPADERNAWFGEEPVPVAANRGNLERLGIAGVEQARLAEVAIRAALGTSAAVRVVPSAGRTPRDGIGALLRWPG